MMRKCEVCGRKVDVMVLNKEGDGTYELKTIVHFCPVCHPYDSIL